MRIARVLAAAVLGLLLLLLSDCPAHAEELGAEEDYSKIYGELLEESGAEELFSLLPEEGQALLEKSGVDGVGQTELMELSFWDFIGGLWDTVAEAAKAPSAAFSACAGVILLCALLQSLKGTFAESTTGRAFSAVAVVCTASAVVLPISGRISSAATLLENMSDFLLSFLPVYTGVVTASGQPVSAVTCTAGLMGMAQVVSQVATAVLVPLLGIYMALCLIGSVSSEMNIEGIAKTVRNVVTVTLGLLLTIFVGLLTVQGTVASAADTVTMRTAKFAAGTFLPVVGGAVSEAMGAVQGCMGVVKSCVGGFGVVAVIAAFLPEILAILLLQLALWLSAGLGETLGVKALPGLLRCASGVLSMLLALLFVFAMLFIVSVSMILALTR